MGEKVKNSKNRSGLKRHDAASEKSKMKNEVKNNRYGKKKEKQSAENIKRGMENKVEPGGYGKKKEKQGTEKVRRGMENKVESGRYGKKKEKQDTVPEKRQGVLGEKVGKPLARQKSDQRNHKTAVQAKTEKSAGRGKKDFEKRTLLDTVCPYAKKCGGCDYQGMDYAMQLKEKQEFVQKNVGEFCKVLPMIGMDHPYHYRNKVHAVFDIVKGSAKGGAFPGTIISGVYKAGTHDVVNIDECKIEDETAGAIIRDIRGLLRSFKIKTYDEDTGYGLLRHVLVRRGFQSGQVMVVLVLGSPILPSKNNFVKALRKLHPEISTIVVNVNNKRTSMVLGEKETVIYGKGYIEDTLCGCTFRISPKSFYQVNPVQTEILYTTAMEYAELTGKETAVDAYCGIGTIGLIAASKAKEVIGVELNRDAVRDAIRNAKRNGIENVQFYNADAGEFMTRMASYDASGDGEKKEVDVVFMDPPRAGSDEAFLASLVKLAPKRVVYVSCNPETLARDLRYLVKHGYEAVKCQGVDMFPFSRHVECVCLMTRKDK